MHVVKLITSELKNSVAYQRLVPLNLRVSIAKITEDTKTVREIQDNSYL
jgi:Trp operon repressor